MIAKNCVFKKKRNKKGVKLVMKLSTSGMSQQGNEGIIFFSIVLKKQYFASYSDLFVVGVNCKYEY